MNNEKFYYYFRKQNSSEGELIVLYIYDCSSISQLNPNGVLFLTANGITLGTSSQVEQLRFPQFAKAGNINATAVFEFKLTDIENLLTTYRAWPEHGIVHFKCVDSDRKLLSESAVFGYPVGIDLPIPCNDNIKRVAGKVKPIGFVISGASWYQAVMSSVQKELGGKNLPKSAPILDWGVGCGRVIRYFIENGYTQVHGIDIDQFNIDWCNANLSSAEFSRCDFDPPTTFADNTFELIYAHSVFTHLSKNDEAAWLSELNRILSLKGIGCVTFTSEFGCHLIYNAGLSKKPSFWGNFFNTGRYDFGALSVGVDDGRPGYYRTVAHTVEYIMEEWSKKIDIIRVVHGFADNQDAVIFKKKTVELKI